MKEDRHRPLAASGAVRARSVAGVTMTTWSRMTTEGAKTRTTEVVYRREARPVITTGAEVMDKIFSG